MNAELRKVWGNYLDWLSTHAPEAHANLASGADEGQLTELEQAVGQALPEQLKSLLRLNDGQRDPVRSCALPGLELLSCQRIAEQWNSWARFRANETSDGLASLDNHANALDAGVLDVYTHPGWIPVLKDGDRSDFIGLDLSPTEGGHIGQIINFGRDEDQHFVAFPTLLDLLEFWLNEVRTGSCTESPPDPPEFPCAWFKHELNGIDVVRRHCDRRRSEG